MVPGFTLLSCLQRSAFTINSRTIESRICGTSSSRAQAQASRSRRVVNMSATEGESDDSEANIMQGPSQAPSKVGVSTLGLSESESAFIEACYNADVEKIESMLDKGVSADTSDVNGRTALHFCAGNGLPTLCDKLLETGATINKQDVMGFTPLHMATGYVKVDTAKLLISRGADANIASSQGKLPVELAEDMLEKTPAKRFFVANPKHDKLKELVKLLDEATEVEEDDEEEETGRKITVNENGEITEETENAKFVVRVKAKGEGSASATPAVKVDDVKVTIKIKEPEKKS